MGMRVLVTGDAGFIGGWLVERLIRENAQRIVVLDNLHRNCVPNPVSFPAPVMFVNADIRDRESLVGAMEGCDLVYHLAAQSNVMRAITDPDYAFTTNVVGTFNVLAAAKAAGVTRVVFTSSREVYGEVDRIPVPETAPINAKNAYGASKAAGELYCRVAAESGLETVILRLANVYGPRDRDRVIPLFIEAALGGQPLTAYGGDQILDFVGIGSVVDALLSGGRGSWVRDPVNIGSGTGTTIWKLAERVLQITGSQSPIQAAPPRSQEVVRFVADTTRSQRLWYISRPEGPLDHLPEVVACFRGNSNPQGG